MTLKSLDNIFSKSAQFSPEEQKSKKYALRKTETDFFVRHVYLAIFPEVMLCFFILP
jgi:hypothetical protein